MTPDERRMIEDLFQRLTQNGGGLDKDPQAERLIADLMRRNPDAAYMLVQTTLVLEYQMNDQQARISELEDRLADLERGSQSSGGGGSFLGGRIGSQRSASSSSVPSAGGYERSGSPWGHQAANQNRGGQSSPGFSGYGSPGDSGGSFGRGQAPVPPQAAQQPAQGGGFFRSAIATAAGVAGGMVLANSLGGLFGGGNQAHAADNSAAMQDADRQQDELQDAQFEADQQQDDLQDASFDAGGDFDSFET